MDEAPRSCGRQGSRSPEPGTETWTGGHGFHSAPGGLSPSRRDAQEPAPARPRFGPRSHLVALRGLSPWLPRVASRVPQNVSSWRGALPLRTHRPAPRARSPGTSAPAPSRLSRCRTAPWALPPAWLRARACWRPGAPTPPTPPTPDGSPGHLPPPARVQVGTGGANGEHGARGRQRPRVPWGDAGAAAAALDPEERPERVTCWPGALCWRREEAVRAGGGTGRRVPGASCFLLP